MLKQELKLGLTLILLLSLLPALMPFIYVEPVDADTGKQVLPIGEIVSQRTENSKTTYLGNGKYSLDSSVGIMHYKDNYANASEQWKDIDLTMVNGKVTKAPYELTIDGLNVTVKDKKTGAITTIGLTDVGVSKVSTPTLSISAGKATASNIATDTDLEISWKNSRISYTRVLKSANAPLDAKFAIAQIGNSITLSTKAEDSKSLTDKSVPVISSIKDGILTESIDSKVALTYPVRIDPTLDLGVTASTDDTSFRHDGSSLLTWVNLLFGDTGDQYKVGVRYLGITIPTGASISTSYVSFNCSIAEAANGVKLDIYGEQNNSSATFSTSADFDSRATTTAKVDWDFDTDWVLNTKYNSPEIKTIIQELVNDYSGLSAANISIFFNNSGSTIWAKRYAYSYDGDANAVAILHIEYVPVFSVTSSAASSVANTTATLNGEVASLFSNNVTLRGFAWGITSNATQPINVTPPASYTTNNTASGNWGTGAFTYGATGLSTGTTYYWRAYAYDGVSYAWSHPELSLLTKPAAATAVAATDGTDTTKVVVTWTKATGATGYKVYEGANLLATLGDVATYDDSAAPAPTISIAGGLTTASDGTSSVHVALNNAGEVGVVGASRTYKVVAFNGTGDAIDSNTDTGYRGTTTLTYQWLISAGDADAGYGNLGGGTTDPYNDVAAVIDDFRYYKVTISMTGAASVTTVADRGWRSAAVPVIATVGASNILTNSAQFNSNLSADGGKPCQITWGWDTVTHVGNFAAYANHYTDVSGNYTSPSLPNYPVAGLIDGTPYFFMVRAQNTGNLAYGAESTFTTTTITTIGAPTYLVGTPTSNTISLTWVRGSSSNTTVVRYMVGSAAPTSNTTGILVYSGALTYSGVTGLTSGRTYSFIAWGVSPLGEWSSSNTTLTLSTLGVASSSTPLADTPTPLDMFTDTDYTKMHNTIFYDIANLTIDNMGIPRDTGWLLGYILFLVAVSIIIAFKTEKLFFGFLASLLLMAFGWLIGLMPMWIPIACGILAFALMGRGTFGGNNG
jgi:hypothetical protein